MSALSPASDSVEPSGSVSPPSYATTPIPPATKTVDESEGKIAYEKPIPEEGIEPVSKVDDDNLPEVVPEGHTFPSNNTIEKPIQNQPVDSKMAMHDNGQHIIPPEQIQSPPPGYQSNGHQMMTMAPPPMNHSSSNFPVSEHHTVTPLNLLGDQSDTIDCPFCRRRSSTLVKKGASWLTHFVAVCLFFLTFCGVLAPYLLHWNSNISHWCQNCNRKVAYRNFGSKTMVPLGTPDHLREVSKFQAASTPTATMNVNAPQNV